MLTEAAQFVIKKALESKFKGKKVDLQIFKCYYDIYFENYNADECIESTQEMLDNMLNGLQYFDSTGNPANIYASLCIFCNKLLSKKEYYSYADNLLKKIVVHSELSRYLDLPLFRHNIMSDFEPDKVKFKRTNYMVYKNYDVFVKLLENTYQKVTGAIMINREAGKYTLNPASAHKVDVNKSIIVYACDPQLKITKIPTTDFQIDMEKDAVTIKTDKRCTIIVTNDRFKRKVE